MLIKLTAAFCQGATAEPGKERSFFWDATKPGFGLMVTANGHRSFVLQYRNQDGISRRMKVKPVLLEAARREAAKILGQVATGGDPLGEKRRKVLAAKGTFRTVAESYFKREGGKLRSIDQRRRVFERLIFPAFGRLPIEAIRRRDVIALLDKIEDERGPVMADRTLAYLGRVFNWHAVRDDTFRSPIVRGMARTSAKERARARILSDDELRRVWKAAGESTGPFGPFVRFVLLSGARRNEAARMTRSEVVNGVWTIPSSRYKTKIDHSVPLSAAALAVLAELPQIGDCDFFFTVKGKTPLRDLSKFKAVFDKAADVAGWRVHDLRRTSRSLLSRAGVNADVAERCLGHVIGGVRGVYDRHEFTDEKRRAFEALAAQIERIANPQENVVPLGGAS